MQNIIWVLVCGSLLVGSAAFAACTADDITLAQNFYNDSLKRENAGQITHTDVRIAETTVLEMQYCAGTVTKAEYCAKKVPLARDMIDVLQYAVNRGAATYEQYGNAIERLARAKMLCGN